MKTHVYLIIDESGSMMGKEGDVVGSLNQYIKELAEGPNPSDFLLTATKFDTEFRPMFVDVTPDKAPVVKAGNGPDFDHYQPRGWTALFDAVGKTLQEAKVADSGENALAVVITDGQENSSKEFTSDKVKELVKRLEASGKWAFVYIGEDQDKWVATQSAASMGYAATTVTSTSSAMKGQTMTSLRNATSLYNSGQTSAADMGQTVQEMYNTEVEKEKGAHKVDPKYDIKKQAEEQGKK